MIQCLNNTIPTSGLSQNQKMLFSNQNQKLNKMDHSTENINNNYQGRYQRFMDDILVNKLFQKKLNQRTKSMEDAEKMSNLFSMNKSNENMQEYVNQKHLLEKNNIMIPFMLGEVYKNNFLDKWLRKQNKEQDLQQTNKKKEEELQAATKQGENLKKDSKEEENDDDDNDFDNWQGVDRDGNPENDKNDDDNDYHGGVMMPIPNAF